MSAPEGDTTADYRMLDDGGEVRRVRDMRTSIAGRAAQPRADARVPHPGDRARPRRRSPARPAARGSGVTERGYPLAQGFHLARPLPADEVTELLR